jgi:acyl-CoA dehydrogenase
MIKIVAPRMACAVIDRAMQLHGAGGLSQDWFLAQAYAGARSLRLADGRTKCTSPRSPARC